MAEGRLQSSEPDEDWNSLVEEEAKPALSKIQEKRNQCIWDNLQKVIYVLVVVYLLTLILHLTIPKENTSLGLGTASLALDDAFLAGKQGQGKEDEEGFWGESAGDLLRGVENGVGKGLREGEAGRETSSAVSVESQLEQARLWLNEGKDTSTRNRQQPSADAPNQEGKRRLGRSLTQSNQPQASHPPEGKSADGANNIERIFSVINEDLHHSVRAVTLQKREQIISAYFDSRRSQHSSIPETLKQNYQIQPQRDGKGESSPAESQRGSGETEAAPAFLCAVVYTHNNAFNGQITRTLNSIFNQDYPHFQVIIADSSSTDTTPLLIRQYLSSPSITNARFLQYNSASLAFSAYSASKTCREGSLVVFLDGNAELIGGQVFATINARFQESRPNIIYADQFSLDTEKEKLQLRRAVEYDESQKFMPLFRDTPGKYGKLLVARSGLLTNLPESYMGQNNHPFQYTGIDSLAVSLLQLSCGKILSLPTPLALSLRDSALEGQERGERMHELKLISMKSKLDYC